MKKALFVGLTFLAMAILAPVAFGECATTGACGTPRMTGGGGSTAPNAVTNLSCTQGTYSDKIVCSWIDNSSVETGTLISVKSSPMDDYEQLLVELSGNGYTSYEYSIGCGSTTRCFLVLAKNSYGVSGFLETATGWTASRE